MRTQITISTATLALVAAGSDSGANYQPSLCRTPMPADQADLDACQALDRFQTRLDEDAIAATGLGAGVGAVLGEADSGHAREGAIAGALVGGVSSAFDAREMCEAIFIKCLHGRGHRVVG